ncbi:MAG: Asp-tRNA(Asn)/Glu-tRNA(Gln) amidotransferase subunit GatB [Patescibacteria group bacterium]|jgi:aspartyl-tRNA(Asn)/glutamyl-tRNA(Gln) amidotransferase subunit B
MKDYRLVLGLEVHFHVKTATKMFCACGADIYGAEPNTHTCPTCLGLPGALPVPNQDAIRKVQLFGLALGGTVNKESRFDRKHYFYPDLPKGYQISQYKHPLCSGGSVTLDSGKIVEIERVHMEEDTAKSFHEKGMTLIDFNKSGMPLGELVTKPVFTSIEDAVEFSKRLQQILRSTGVGDADMEKGQMRLEANISIRTPEMPDTELPNYKVEIKNINSFRFLENAVNAEVTRQIEILKSGGKVIQENRGYDEATKSTVSQRIKEEAHDYRYFPEPDIPSMVFDDTYIEELRKRLPELPEQKADRFCKDYGLTSAISRRLVSSEALCMFEELMGKGQDAVLTANNLLNKPEYLAMSVDEYMKVQDQAKDKISGTGDLMPVIERVLAANPSVIDDYRKGKTSSIEFLVGMVMRETKGKADAGVVRDLISKNL